MSDEKLTAFGEVIERIAKNAEANQVSDESDYINPEDGLLYCGKCHTPKQCRIKLPTNLGGGREITPPVLCKCEQEERDREEQVKREREEMEYIRQLKIASLMDERFRDQSFETFKATKYNGKILRLSKRYVDKFKEMIERNQGLLFYGDVGTGKSFTAACIANALMEKRVPVVMTSFVKLLENTKGFDSDEEKLIKQLNRAKLLIIDDLGAERSSDYALEKVYNIVDSRYRARLPMLITTNLEMQEMQSCSDIRYKRIYDRIFEICYPVRFDGPSFRKNEAKKRFDEMRSLLEGDYED